MLDSGGLQEREKSEQTEVPFSQAMQTHDNRSFAWECDSLRIAGAVRSPSLQLSAQTVQSSSRHLCDGLRPLCSTIDSWSGVRHCAIHSVAPSTGIRLDGARSRSSPID